MYLKTLERAAGIEPATYSLGSCRSTTELRPQLLEKQRQGTSGPRSGRSLAASRDDSAFVKSPGRGTQRLLAPFRLYSRAAFRFAPSWLNRQRSTYRFSAANRAAAVNACLPVGHPRSRASDRVRSSQERTGSTEAPVVSCAVKARATAMNEIDASLVIRGKRIPPRSPAACNSAVPWRTKYNRLWHWVFRDSTLYPCLV